MSDLRDLRPGSALVADVCIIGAGPVGITVGHELAPSAETVVLEAGGVSPEAKVQPGPKSRAVGLPYELESARRRAVGGTAHAWDLKLPDGRSAAFMRPLEPIDFLARDWVPRSGWPLGAEALADAYRRACELTDVSPTVLEGDFPVAPSSLLPLPVDRIRSVPLYYAPAAPFVSGDSGLLRNIRVWRHAPVVRLETDPAGGRVVAAVVRLPDGRGEVTMRADVYVLAAGGVENARLLLASRDASPRGIGNAHDLVGRCFMEHPQGVTGVFVPTKETLGRLPAYARHERGGAAARLHLYVSEQVLRAERLLGYYASLWPTEPDWLPDDLMDLALRARRAFGEEAPLFAVSFLAEQAPNPDSRVLLSEDGEVVVDWRLSALEYRTLVRAQQVLQEELTLAGLGTLFTKPYRDETGGFETGRWRSYDFPIEGAHHHLGTTRMHPDPRQGVVDADCRVHGVANLYVAGSSVFPTGSHVNPTLTALALAVRLAHHLREGAMPA